MKRVVQVILDDINPRCAENGQGCRIAAERAFAKITILARTHSKLATEFDNLRRTCTDDKHVRYKLEQRAHKGIYDTARLAKGESPLGYSFEHYKNNKRMQSAEVCELATLIAAASESEE
jgi:hypothetical protein